MSSQGFVAGAAGTVTPLCDDGRMDATSAIAAVGAAVDALAAAPLDTADAAELRTQLSSLKVAESKLTAQLGRFTHAADAVNAWVGTGARDTAEWLGRETGTSTRKNRSAAELGEAMDRSAELAAAVTSGGLSSDKATAAAGAAGGHAIDADLLDEIADLPLPSVKPATERWRARNDAAGEEDRAARRRARRFLRLTGADDGMTRVEGLLDPSSASIVRTTLDAIMNESAFDGTDRTRDQRCADALAQLAAAASKGDISGGRSNAKVLAITPFETVCDRGELPGWSHVGTTLDAATIRQMCCDAGIHRVVSGPGSSILDFGRETRLVSDNLFLALVARDQHCRWPGCTVRATWCDAHHVIEWLDGGGTSERTCALLCHYHHSVTHLPGWSVTGDGHEFTIHHPDGTTQVSRPPRSVGAPPDPSGGTSAGLRPDGADPPTAGTPRADSIGREPSTDDVLESLQRTVRQLELV